MEITVRTTGDADYLRAPVERGVLPSGDGEDAIGSAVRGVEDVRAHLPAWMRSLADVIDEAGRASPDRVVLMTLLEAGGPPAPTRERVARADIEALGLHGALLTSSLADAGKWWARADEGTLSNSELGTVVAAAQRAKDALGRAMQHALYLTFLDEARQARVGQACDIDAYCSGWGVQPGQINEIWLWVTQDGLRFGEERLKLAIDTRNRCVYRKVRGPRRWWCAMAPLWGAGLVYGLVALLFLVLHDAGLVSWTGLWGWKLLVLVVFVLMGALLHLGAKALNVNYDDPIEVYDAGGIVDWLSLHWLGILWMYVPAAFVVAGLWGAGNIPTSFRALGTAILAGYGADSAFNAARSSVGKTSAKKDPATPAAASAGAD